MAFNDTIENIKQILGEESSALVADDLISLMSEHKSVEDTVAEQSKTIDTLKAEKEGLVTANAKLFQRIGTENHLTESASEMVSEIKEPEKINLSDLINSKGELI